MGFWEIEILHFMQKVLAFLEASPVSVVFSLFLLVAALLNIFRCWLISWEKKQVSPLETCKFLLLGKKVQECTLSSRKQGFLERERSCEGCEGKAVKITNSEAEERARLEARWKNIVICIANAMRAIMPYVSICYTLAITFVQNNTK